MIKAQRVSQERSFTAPCGCPDNCTMNHMYCRCDDTKHMVRHFPRLENESDDSYYFQASEVS